MNDNIEQYFTKDSSPPIDTIEWFGKFFDKVRPII